MPYQAHCLMMAHPWIVLQRGEVYFGLLGMIDDDSSSRISHENNYWRSEVVGLMANLKCIPNMNTTKVGSKIVYSFVLLKADLP